MTSHNQLPQTFQPRLFAKYALIGAAFAFALITLFFFGDGPPFDYGFRVYFPTLTTTAGGAAGGILYSLFEPLRSQGGAKKVLGIGLGLLACVVAIWFSAVFGLAITGDWD